MGGFWTWVVGGGAHEGLLAPLHVARPRIRARLSLNRVQSVVDEGGWGRDDKGVGAKEGDPKLHATLPLTKVSSSLEARRAHSWHGCSSFLNPAAPTVLYSRHNTWVRQGKKRCTADTGANQPTQNSRNELPKGHHPYPCRRAVPCLPIVDSPCKCLGLGSPVTQLQCPSLTLLQVTLQPARCRGAHLHQPHAWTTHGYAKPRDQMRCRT